MPISLKTGRALATAAALLLLAACGSTHRRREPAHLSHSAKRTGPAAGLGAYPAE